MVSLHLIVEDLQVMVSKLPGLIPASTVGTLLHLLSPSSPCCISQSDDARGCGTTRRRRHRWHRTMLPHYCTCRKPLPGHSV